MIKVYGLTNTKTFEICVALDDKGIGYEMIQPDTEWVVTHKVKQLPVVEIDGKMFDYKKAMKWIKKQKG